MGKGPDWISWKILGLSRRRKKPVYREGRVEGERLRENYFTFSESRRHLISEDSTKFVVSNRGEKNIKGTFVILRMI